MWDSFRSRWMVGIQLGLVVAGLASLWVIVGFVVTNGSSLANKGLSLPVVLLAYLAGALGGSIVFAVVGPLFRSRLGSGLGGFLITVPLFAVIVATLPGEDLRTLDSWRAVALSAAFIGGLGGFVYWEPTRRPEEGP